MRPSRGDIVTCCSWCGSLGVTFNDAEPFTGRAVGAVDAMRLWWRRSRPAFMGLPLPPTQICLSLGCLTWLSCLKYKESRVAEFRHGLRGRWAVFWGCQPLFFSPVRCIMCKESSRELMRGCSDIERTLSGSQGRRWIPEPSHRVQRQPGGDRASPESFWLTRRFVVCAAFPGSPRARRGTHRTPQGLRRSRSTAPRSKTTVIYQILHNSSRSATWG